MRLFAIGDIHGCSRTLRRLLIDKIGIRIPDEIICVGDYIDRGPDSRGVVDFLLDLRSQGFTVHTLRGNHEQLMLDSDGDPESLIHWLRNGGNETLQSFGVSAFSQLDAHYRSFFESTQYIVERDNYIFVHAGLDWTAEDPFQNIDAMLWTREPFIDHPMIGDRIIIHGHTPLTLEIILAQDCTRGPVNIDGGCFHTQRTGLGHLIALELDSMEFYVAKNVG